MIIADPSSLRSDRLYAELQHLKQLRPVYDWIGRAVSEIDPKLVCIVVQNDEVSNRGIVGGFYGLSEGWFHRLINILGVNPIGRTYHKTAEGEKFFYTVKTAREFNGRLYDLAEGQVPKWITVTIERIFGIQRIFTIALNHGRIPLGTMLLFPRDELKREQWDNLESIAAAASRKLLDIRNEKLGFSSHESFANALISQINHEIRTPLNGILGLMSEVVEGSSEKENSSEIMEDLIDCADQLQRTVDNLVLNANLNANRIVFQFQKVSVQQVGECIHRTVESLDKKYPEQAVIFKSTYLKSKQYISADIRYMKIALIELLDNALKFSTIDIQVNLFHDDESLILEIEDFGSGVPAAVVHEIFKPFIRGGIERKHYQGNGVGLSIAKKIVDAHEYQLSLEETSPHGSLFVLKMPYLSELSRDSQIV